MISANGSDIEIRIENVSLSWPVNYSHSYLQLSTLNFLNCHLHTTSPEVVPKLLTSGIENSRILEIMEKWAQKTAFIAGANSGIGAAVTRRFLECEIKVYAMDRNVDFLNDLKSDEEVGDNLVVLQADITSEEDVLRFIKSISDTRDEINIVVYSIGIVGNNSLIDGDFSEWQNLVNVNVLSFCTCMKEIVNHMLKRNVKEGHIIVINSIVALETTVFPELHFYAATKCAMGALTEGLQHELRENRSPIKVTQINAGLVKTDLYKNSLGTNVDSPIFKTLVSLSVDDITEAVEYLLSTPSNMAVNRLVITPRGIFKQNFFQNQPQ